MNGAPAKIHSIDGTNVTQVVIAAPMMPAAIGEKRRGVAEGGEETDELRDQDQRPGVVSARPRPSTISGAVIQ